MKKLKPCPFITNLVRDPARPPKLRALRGFVGESAKKGCVRLYLDVDLRRYVDVPSKGIAHVEQVGTEGTSLDLSYIWVDEKVSIHHGGSWAASEDPTTMATGEEGDPDPTTMATGEESTGFENPIDPVVNPFGRFR